MSILNVWIGLISLLFTSGFVAESSIPTHADQLVVDDLGNYYFIYPTYLERFNALNNQSFRTSELNYGNVDYLDVTNPLKPFVHFRDNGVIVFFDNTLSQMGNAVDLYEKGWGQIELVAGSRGDAFWLWDARNAEMIRVDNNFRKVSSTGNLAVLLGKSISPLQIIERGNAIYLRDKKLGVLVFDVYGSYRMTLPIFSDSDIQIFQEKIIARQNQELLVHAVGWLSEVKYPLPVLNCKSATFFNNRLYTLQADSMTIWRWSEK